MRNKKNQQRSRTVPLRNYPEYRAYGGAKSRCNNARHSAWRYYGGRGIRFKFKTFEEFFKEVGKRPSKEHSLNRRDNNGHYELGNVEWSTKAEQAHNRRHYTHKVRHGSGVSKHKKSGKWVAYLWYMGKPLYLGLFNTKREATQARNSEMQKRGLRGTDQSRKVPANSCIK